jgi:REP element-mobilizing transposase RayT
MPQSLSNLLAHVVFSTKDRVPFFDASTRNELNAYVATVVRNTKCECFRVGGTADHVHLAIRLHRTVAAAKLVEVAKTASSVWLKTKSPSLRSFSWQRGYGAFSLGAKELEPLLAYIADQEQHHKAHSFQSEYRAFLVENGIDFDERCVWD